MLIVPDDDRLVIEVRASPADIDQIRLGQTTMLRFAAFNQRTPPETQMLPPVGLIIPYYLALQRIGGLDTYGGLTLIYLTFSLPFAIWLMVSYFEDIPHRDGGSGAPRPCRPLAHAPLRDPAAGPGRHRGDGDLRVSAQAPLH